MKVVRKSIHILLILISSYACAQDGTDVVNSEAKLTPDQLIELIHNHNNDKDSGFNDILDVEDIKSADGNEGVPSFAVFEAVLKENNLTLLWIENRLLPMRSSKSIELAIRRYNEANPNQKINGYNELKKYRYVAGLPLLEDMWSMLIKEQKTFFEILTNRRDSPKGQLDLLNEFQDFIAWHNKKHPDEKVEIGLEWQQVQKKYNYADYISLFKGRVDWNLVFNRQKRVKTAIKISTQEELTALIEKHNTVDHPKDPIRTQAYYEEVAPKYHYPITYSLRRNLKDIDWDVVFNRPIAKPGEIIITSTEDLFHLMLKHNQNHPEYPIRSTKEFKDRSGKYNYPFDERIEGIIENFDWKNVYSRPKAIASEIEINTLDELKDLIDTHNADPEKLEKIHSSTDYAIAATHYHYPSPRTLHQKFGNIDWNKLLNRSRVTKSEIEINTNEELKKLIDDHNRAFPNDKITSVNDYIQLSRDYRYPSETKLRRIIVNIDWAYALGKVEVSQIAQPNDASSDDRDGRKQTNTSSETKSAEEKIITQLRNGIIGELMLMNAKDFPVGQRYYTELDTKIRYEVVKILFQILQDFDSLSDAETIQLLKDFGNAQGPFEKYFQEIRVKLDFQHTIGQRLKVRPYKMVTNAVRNSLNAMIVSAKLPMPTLRLIDDNHMDETRRKIDTLKVDGTKARLLEVIKHVLHK